MVLLAQQIAEQASVNITEYSCRSELGTSGIGWEDGREGQGNNLVIGNIDKFHNREEQQFSDLTRVMLVFPNNRERLHTVKLILVFEAHLHSNLSVN